MMKLSRQQCCGFGMFIPDPEFRIRIFSKPDTGSEFFPSLIRIKKLKYFTPKNLFQALGNMIRIVHPGSATWFSTHHGSLIQGSKRHRLTDPGSATLLSRSKWKVKVCSVSLPSLVAILDVHIGWVWVAGVSAGLLAGALLAARVAPLLILAPALVFIVAVAVITAHRRQHC